MQLYTITANTATNATCCLGCWICGGRTQGVTCNHRRCQCQAITIVAGWPAIELEEHEPPTLRPWWDFLAVPWPRPWRPKPAPSAACRVLHSQRRALRPRRSGNLQNWRPRCAPRVC